MRKSLGSLVVAGALAMSMAGCSDGTPDHEATIEPTNTPEPTQSAPPEPEPEPTETTEATPDPEDEIVFPVVDESYWEQFPDFEPIHMSRYSDNVKDMTEGIYELPEEISAWVTTVRSPSGKLIHVFPAGPQGQTGHGYDAPGKRTGHTQLQFAVNVADDGSEPLRHVRFNTVWDDWEAVYSPVNDLPMLSDAVDDQMSGGPGVHVFRVDGMPRDFMVRTSATFSADGLNTRGKKVPVYGASPRDGEEHGYLLVPAGVAWLTVEFDDEWQLDAIEIPDLTPAGVTPPPSGGQDVYRHDGSAIEVALPPGSELHAVTYLGRIYSARTGDSVEIPADTWWTFVREIPEG